MKTANLVSAFAVGLTSAAAVGLVAPTAEAATIETHYYELGSHPDGTEAPPAYGLRIDGINGLFDGVGPASDDVVTFDFDHPNSAMNLTYVVDSDPTQSVINISGTAFGGVDIGDTYGDTFSAVIDFTYRQIDTDQENFAEVNGREYFGEGTLTVGGQTIYLRAKDAGGNFFNLGTDHRGEAGLSGWGWLQYSLSPEAPEEEWYGSNDGRVADWLFTAEKVPEPTMTLGLLAVGGLMISRRKRSAEI
ncbi:MAG: PEP-CTERM sorting domain-containing protein [Cyanobacteria bacterium P01_F01_bin.153]